MLELVQEQLVYIPELRIKVRKVTKENMGVLLKMSKSMDQELTRLKQKHLADLNRPGDYR
jgi:hypothetical protein